jgi:AAA domain-containing protein
VLASLIDRMRIAVTGTHVVGKSTLVADLAAQLPTYEVLEEPYYDLLDEGVPFSETPTPEDFEVQLERSVELMVMHCGSDVLFDRCPVDYFAYLASLGNAGRNTLFRWLPLAADALKSLDLVILVPVERPDRIVSVSIEHAGMRKRVNRLLERILFEDELGLRLHAIEVTGSPDQRVQQVLDYLASRT